MKDELPEVQNAELPHPTLDVVAIELRPNVENAGDVVDLLLGFTRFLRARTWRS